MESEKLLFDDEDSTELDLYDFEKIDELMSQMTEAQRKQFSFKIA